MLCPDTIHKLRQDKYLKFCNGRNIILYNYENLQQQLQEDCKIVKQSLEVYEEKSQKKNRRINQMREEKEICSQRERESRSKRRTRRSISLIHRHLQCSLPGPFIWHITNSHMCSYVIHSAQAHSINPCPIIIVIFEKVCPSPLSSLVMTYCNCKTILHPSFYMAENFGISSIPLKFDHRCQRCPFSQVVL